MKPANQSRPLCFVIMPFGKKTDPTGKPDIDFDRIYHQAIEPAIINAGMEPVRADEERSGGIIHKPMFERLMLCDFAIADLTTANANVFYELGVRHTARPRTTLTIFAQHQPIPFDVNFLRSLPYEMGKNNRFGKKQIDQLYQNLLKRLKQIRKETKHTAPVDSPVFELLSEWNPGEIARLKTDVFRERVQLDQKHKHTLAGIRERHKAPERQSQARDDLAKFRKKMGKLDAHESAVIIDMLLTYRALSDWNGMIQLYNDMPEILKRQIMVREQLGFAWSRKAGITKDPADRKKALSILEDVVEQQGPSSETYGLIGRIYKDQWKEAKAVNKSGQSPIVKGMLNKAIEAYRSGFLADQRDAYPGINLLTLLDIKGSQPALEEKDKLLPVVRFAVEQRLAGSAPDYWDYATLLELAILDNQQEEAEEYLAQALSCLRETWEANSTADNLDLIWQARKERQQKDKWLKDIIRVLKKAGKSQ